jgi:hypothetical protein
MARHILILEAAVENCSAEFYFNDIPLVRLVPGVTERAAVPVNEFLVAGRNTVEVVLQPGPTPATARTEPQTLDDSAMTALGRLTLYPPDSFPGESVGRRYLQVAYRGGGKQQRFPWPVSQDVQLDSPFGAWSWQRADVLHLTSAVHAEVRGVIRSVQDLYRSRQFDRLLAFKHLGLSEWATAYGESAADQAASMRRVFDEEIWGSPDWSIENLDPAQYDLRLCAQGRLVECIAKDWWPIVRAAPTPSGARTRFAMLLGRLRGEWFQLR